MDKKKEARHCSAVAPHENYSILQQNDNTFSESKQQTEFEIVKKFEPKKQMSLVIAAAYDYLGYKKRSVNVLGCGTFLEYYLYSDKAKLHSANFCKDRFCPMCNWRRSLKIFGQVSAVMDVLQNERYRFLFLTLTVKNVDRHDLCNEIDALQKGWFNLIKQKRFKGAVCGSFKSLEITKNKTTGQYHPHYHVILAVEPLYFKKYYISQSDWAVMWQSACQLDYNPIVHIQTIKSKDPKEDDSKGDLKALSSAVAEVAKYSVKDSDIIDDTGDIEAVADTLKDLIGALTNRRLCSFTGCFRGARKQLELDDIEKGDLVHTSTDEIREDIEYCIIRYQWRNGVYISE